MAENEDGPGLSYRQVEIARARDALFGAQWRGYAAGVLSDGAAGGGSEGFRVDPERIDDAIRKLDGILYDLRETLNICRRVRFNPPGFDDVSINAANNSALMGQRAAAYISAWMQQIGATRDALGQELADYTATDKANAGRLP